MKKLAILLLCAAGAFAQQLTLSIENQGQIRAGNTLQIKASLTGSSAATMAAFQFALRSSVGGTWTVTPASGATAASKQATCAMPDVTAQDLRCVVAGLNANTIPDGAVLSLTLDIPANAPTGQVSLVPNATLGATGAADAVALSANTVTFILASPLNPCDLNSDGAINVVDAQLIINQILGLAPKTADLDQDGYTTIVDYQRVAIAANGGACKVGR